MKMLLYFKFNNSPSYFFADAICPSEIANVLNLHEVRDRRWFINGASAPNGNGLNDSMIAMVEAIRK